VSDSAEGEQGGRVSEDRAPWGEPTGPWERRNAYDPVLHGQRVWEEFVRARGDHWVESWYRDVWPSPSHRLDAYPEHLGRWAGAE
jgi:hypothetical protein